MAKQNKIYQPEQITVLRSQINFAPYNPRKISEEARKQLKKNLIRVGVLGGIVWNKRTGNLVSGHQKVSIMDSVNRYDPETGKNDYELRVEPVDFDLKTEKEQNLFFNNRNVQGEYDEDLLRSMLDGIDYSLAGFGEFDMQMLGLSNFGDYDPMGDFGDDSEEDTDDRQPGSPTASDNGHGAWTKEQAIGEREDLAIHDDITKESGENHKLDRSTDFYSDSEANQIARHNEVQKIKDRIARQNDVNKDGGMLSYVVISFKTPDEKLRFMEEYGFDPTAKYINGQEFVNRLEFGDDSFDDEPTE